MLPLSLNQKRELRRQRPRGELMVLIVSACSAFPIHTPWPPPLTLLRLAQLSQSLNSCFPIQPLSLQVYVLINLFEHIFFNLM